MLGPFMATRVILGSTLIDGTGAAPVADAAVVIDGNRIVAAGPRASVPQPSGAEVIDGAGLTILPGLIDTHDHLASHGYALSRRWGLEEPASTAHLRTAAVLRRTLAAGYTTIRDAGGLDAGFKLAVDEGLASGPRLVTALAIISPTGGIGDSVSPSGHECCVAAGPNLPRSVANGVDAVREVVRTMVRAGRSEEHTSELQSLRHLVCRLLLEKKKKQRCAACSSSTAISPPP